MIYVKCWKHSELSISANYCWWPIFPMLLKAPHLCDQLNCLCSECWLIDSWSSLCWMLPSCLTECMPWSFVVPDCWWLLTVLLSATDSSPLQLGVWAPWLSRITSSVLCHPHFYLPQGLPLLWFLKVQGRLILQLSLYSRWKSRSVSGGSDFWSAVDPLKSQL